MASGPGTHRVHMAGDGAAAASCQDFPRGRVVVHDQHAETGQLFRQTILPDPLAVPTPSQTVKKNVLPTPASLSSQIAAAHQLDQAPADGQAQPGAAVLAGGGHVGLRERLEQLRRLLRRHADAGVAHGELELHFLARAFEQFDVQPDLAALGELDRVVDEVGEDLAEAERVARAGARGSRARHGPGTPGPCRAPSGR